MLSETTYLHVFAFRLVKPVPPDFWDRINGYLAESRKLPGVLVCTMQKNVSPFAGAFSHVYFGIFKDRAAHEAYQVHDLHDRIAALLLPVAEWSAVSDLDMAALKTVA